ncbi:hypothetical protein HBI18_126300 [Parastagonospora nodorum]|nr:hypothetical protein HBI78_063910 [Parastagonospora nodorum]KAH5201757.1 hypothetical protein HBH77_121450 [Parastagonospora nodorum]KAH5724795.1 hypothetical protein HBI18_126300 [Parastagonospora nodorum]
MFFYKHVCIVTTILSTLVVITLFIACQAQSFLQYLLPNSMTLLFTRQWHDSARPWPSSLLRLVSAPVHSAARIHRRNMTTGTYAGMCIGSGVFIVICFASLVILAWKKGWWPFKKRFNGNTSNNEKDMYEKGELHGEAIPRFETMGKERMELEAKEHMPEMDAADCGLYEVAGLDLLHELDGQSPP